MTRPIEWVPEQHRHGGEWSTRSWPDPVAQAAQLAVDAAVAPGRVLPGQPQHQSAELGRHGRTATPMGIGPPAPDQLPMPPQQRSWLDQQPAPARTGQQPRGSGQHRPVCPVDPRPGHPVGCGNSNIARELASSRQWATRCCDAATRRPHHRGHTGAAETPLPHAMPFHPDARAACPRGRRQGPGDPGATPPAHRPAPPSHPTQAGADRPSVPRRGQPRAATGSLVLLHRQARNPAALAPPPDRRELDVSAPPTGPPPLDEDVQQLIVRLATENPRWGLPAHQGRAAPARHTSLGHRSPRHAPPPRARSCPTADEHDLAGVPAPASRRDRGMRRFHRRHHLAATAVGAVPASNSTLAASTWPG